MLLITNGRIVTMDAERRVIRHGAVLIEGNRIKDIGQNAELLARYPDVERLDAADNTVMPGLINTHTHLFQSLFRGLGDDLSLTDWITKCIYPLSTQLMRRESKIGALLNELEMIKTGTTTFNDSHYINIDKHCHDAIAEATEEIGMRGIIGRAAVNNAPVPEVFHETPDVAVRECERVIKAFHGSANGRITVRVEPMSEALTTRDMVQAIRAVSREYQVGMNMHAAETITRVENMRRKYGFSTIEFLYDAGVLGPDVLLGHCIWISRKEIEILRVTDTKVAHNSVSNQYLADGVAPIPELIRAGVTVGLGPDGAASNNNQDMFQAMKLAVLMQKANRLDPESLTAEKALEMATIDGAKALNMEKEIGSLEVGKKADLIIVSNQVPEMRPTLAFVSNLVYAASGALVDTVIIDGRIVMHKREVLTIDEEKLLSEIDGTVMKMVRDSGCEAVLHRSKWKYQ